MGKDYEASVGFGLGYSENLYHNLYLKQTSLPWPFFPILNAILKLFILVLF